MEEVSVVDEKIQEKEGVTKDLGEHGETVIPLGNQNGSLKVERESTGGLLVCVTRTKSKEGGREWSGGGTCNKTNRGGGGRS